MPRLGSHIVVGLSATELTSAERELIREFSPSGIVLFRHNIDCALPPAQWQEKLARLIEEAREASGRDHFLVSIDHEGGRVHRFPEPVTHFPAAACYAENAYEVGLSMGQELRALGFNLSFAPVLDVFSEPSNTVIGDRAFSTNASEVAERGIAMAEGLLAAGVLPCGKHFPGHGATIADSHFELPELLASESEMQSRELQPFKSFIASKHSPMIMTAHVRYPLLDADNPATFSPSIIGKLLRRDMAFSGVVITDDLGMMAVCDLSLGERALRALNVGVDLLLVGNPKSGNPVEEMRQMIDQFQALVDQGLLKVNLEESKQRIENLTSSISASSSDLSVVGCQKHKELCLALRGSE